MEKDVDQLLKSFEEIASSRADSWRSLPPAAFQSQALYELETEHLFYRGWVLVGRVDQVKEPGDYLCFDVLDEPIVVVRDLDSKLRVLSRVCRHRWMHVCASHGNTHAFVCPYHAWTYGLDGRLRHAPEMDATPGFDPANTRLPELRAEIWEGFIFVNVSADAPALSETLSLAREQLAAYDLQNWVTVRSIDLGENPWDWKVFMDNGEIYHHLMLHRDTVEPRSPASLSVASENDGGYFLLHGPADPSVLITAEDGRPMMPSYLRPVGTWSPSRLTPLQRTSATYFYPYPNYVIVLWVNVGVFFRVTPLAAGRCHIRADYMVPKELAAHPDLENAMDQAVAAFSQVHREDARACTAVQKAVGSRFAEQASLSHIEDFNLAFARWYAGKMVAAAAETANPT
jgi:phenylpropionate dioxygenase-like ring-hydroxylating dioxygenase large terminal subunit